MDTPSLPENELASIKEALFGGHKIQAIKIYRAATGVGLADAKTAVEKLESELRLTSPELFAPRRTGCVGLLAVFLALVGLVYWSIAG